MAIWLRVTESLSPPVVYGKFENTILHQMGNTLALKNIKLEKKTTLKSLVYYSAMFFNIYIVRKL